MVYSAASSILSINMNYVYLSRLITRIHLLKKDFETSYRRAFIKLAFAFTGF